MSGSLAYSRGVVYVGTEELTAHVRSFDLDGRELEANFSFRAAEGGPASVRGLAVDEDHRVWVADGVDGQLRAFTLFGDQVAGVESVEPGQSDRGGVLGTLSAVISRGCDELQELVIASCGRRRHAVQCLPLGSGRASSLRSTGHVDQPFNDVSGLHGRDSWLWVCERGAGRVQLFRDGDFHQALKLEMTKGARFRPNALQSLDDGRLVVAQGGAASAVLLLDPNGKLLRILAETGDEVGCVSEPTDLVVEPGADDRHTRVVVIDAEGTRVQVLNLEGDSYGTFPGFARSDPSWETS
ncbi:MAG: sugar lactone lactonase YvrE [Candidatus Paceibacteria bacterium]